MRRCKHPHETDATEQDAESQVEQYFKLIKTLQIAARDGTDGARSRNEVTDQANLPNVPRDMNDST